MRFCGLWIQIVPLMLLLGVSASGQTAGDPVDFYTNESQAALATKCYACHTQTAMGGLRLDSREGVQKGGASGPATARACIKQPADAGRNSHTLQDQNASRRSIE